jgi:hypothetical protein
MATKTTGAANVANVGVNAYGTQNALHSVFDVAAITGADINTGGTWVTACVIPPSAVITNIRVAARIEKAGATTAATGKFHITLNDGAYTDRTIAGGANGVFNYTLATNGDDETFFANIGVVQASTAVATDDSTKKGHNDTDVIPNMPDVNGSPSEIVVQHKVVNQETVLIFEAADSSNDNAATQLAFSVDYKI